MSSNEWEQARAYVEQLREEGRTDEEIRQVMLKSGWTEEQIEKLFAREVPQAPAAPPPAQPGARPGAAPPERPGAASRPRPRPSAKRADVGGCGVAWILLVSLFLPPAGLIIGLIWLVSPQPAKKKWGVAGIAVSLAVLLVLAGSVLSAHNRQRERVMQTMCNSQMKQLAIGTLLYAQDHNLYLPDAANWQQELAPYIRARQCPKGGTYAMNPKLSRMHMSQLPDHGVTTVLFYEADDSGKPLPKAHGPEGANYAFADGHVKWLHHSSPEAREMAAGH